MAPPSPDRCVPYASEDVRSAGNQVTIARDADALRFTLASEEATQRALQLAKDHNRVCFLRYDAYAEGRHNCGERTPC